MQRRAVWIEARARRIHIHSGSYHPAQRVCLSIERRQYERELLFILARGGHQAIDIIPLPQTQRRSKRHVRPTLQEMLGGGKVTVDQGVVRVAAGDGASVDQRVDELDLYATLARDPGP